MCGIFGMIHPSKATANNLKKFKVFFDVQKHRGPDGVGEYLGNNFALGMVRLSIIDSMHGWQPLWNEDKTIGVIANGEIYNYLELRDDLLNSGHHFSTQSDIEILVHLYEERDLDFVNDLRGMFAFALIDIPRNRIIIGRDRLGEKPLYIYESNGSIVFSSEIRSLIQTGFAPLEFENAHLESYFKYGFIPEPYTLIKNIRKVESGTIEVFSLTENTNFVQRYWDTNSILEDTLRSSDEELRSILEEISEIVIRSDVPVGIALSSGLDSSIVASLTKSAEHHFRAFTIGYEGKHSSDESADATKLANKIGIIPHILKLNSLTVGRNFSELCMVRDEPIADIAGAAYLELANLARSHGVKVLLTGQGADELFWGYKWVRDIVNNQNRRLRLLNGRRNYLQYFRFSRIEFAKGPFLDWLRSGGGLVENTRQLFEDLKDAKSGNRDVLVYERRRRAREIKSVTKSLLPIKHSNNLYQQESTIKDDDVSYYVMKTMVETYLKSNGLGQVDRLSMAASVEARTPFVDHKIVEFAFRELKRFNRPTLGSKSILIEAVDDLLPPEIKSRKKKGFTPPVKEWYQAIFEMNQENFKNPRIVELQLVSEKAIKMLGSPLSIIGRPRLLWLELAVLEMWVRGLEASVPISGL